jgi:hypothetical protein
MYGGVGKGREKLPFTRLACAMQATVGFAGEFNVSGIIFKPRFLSCGNSVIIHAVSILSFLSKTHCCKSIMLRD